MDEKHFVAPLAKIERAKFQIEEINAATQAFVKGAKWDIISRIDNKANEEIWSFRLIDPIPDDISVRAGEVIHNLRTSIEQMYIEVAVHSDGMSSAGLQFPFGRDRQAFEAALKKQKSRITSDIACMIEDMQPYKGGDDLMWFLHDANIGDKHRIGLVPINLITGGANSFLSTWEGQALFIGSRTGQHLVCERWITSTEILRYRWEGRPTGLYGLCILDPKTGEPVASGRARIVYENHGPGSAEGTYEFLTTTPGTRFKTDFQPSFGVAFRDLEPFQRKPIGSVLFQLRDLVARSVERFHDKFFR